MRVALGLGLILLSVVSYFLLAVNLGIYQRYPVPHFLGVALGLLVLGRQVAERRSVLRVVALVFGIVISGLYVWLTLGYSTYATRELRVREGQTVNGLATLSLADHEGTMRPVLTSDDGSRATLLVFYRGFW